MSEVAKKYARSAKGKATRKRIRKSEKNKELQKRWRESGGSAREYQRNKHRYRDKQLQKMYGISLAEYDIKREEQHYSCKICKVHESELKKSLAVDHCHVTGRIRSLLCTNCNSALGQAGDSIQRLENMIQYLKDHQ